MGNEAQRRVPHEPRKIILIMKPLLEIKQLHQRFGTLEVLKDIGFEIYPGEVIGLAALSGAGKSVLAKLCAGLYRATTGGIWCQGKQIHSPSSALRYGMEVIHQFPRLVESLDITSNIFLGHEIFWSKWLSIPDQVRMEHEAERMLIELDVELPSLNQNIANLTSEQQQLIAIARAMASPAMVIVIDEPMHNLSYPYQQKLLSLIQHWQQKGKAILFASTNLAHLFAVSDRIMVLRNGQMVGWYRTDETTREEIVAAMVGQTSQAYLTPVIWALESYHRALDRAEQLYRQTSLLERDLVAQGTLNQQLLDQLTQQVKALDQANAALQDAHRRLLTEREQERKHLARELHDQVIQDLLSTNYQLEEIAFHYQTVPQFQTEIEAVRAAIREMVDNIRLICGNLRPPTIDSLGLTAAIQSFTREWSKRTGIDVKLQLSPHLGRLPEAIELSIFRIVQEGLSNVVRHSDATRVEIGLQHSSPRTLMIMIADNGYGLSSSFDLSKLSAQGHYGLLGISERVALLNGQLRLKNGQTGGLVLQAEIPHPRVDLKMPSIGEGQA
jgi:signal transduction histidine kinase